MDTPYLELLERLDRTVSWAVQSVQSVSPEVKALTEVLSGVPQPQARLGDLLRPLRHRREGLVRILSHAQDPQTGLCNARAPRTVGKSVVARLALPTGCGARGVMGAQVPIRWPVDRRQLNLDEIVARGLLASQPRVREPLLITGDRQNREAWSTKPREHDAPGLPEHLG